MFAAPLLHAAPLSGIHLPASALFGKTKMINVKVQNASQAPVTLRAGDQQVIVQPGASSMFKLVEGAQIVNVEATPTMTAGMVIATAANNLNGSTLTLH